jgi:hypothetical protein
MAFKIIKSHTVDFSRSILLYILANGDVYAGDYKDGKRCGNGKYTFKSGAYYDGEWLNDKYHGIGTYYTKEGVGRKCRYEEDKCVEELK